MLEKKTTHDKMLSISSHQGNADETAVRWHLTPAGNGYHQKDRQEPVFVRRWRSWSPLTLRVAMGKGAATLENGLAVPQKKLKRELLYDPDIFF